MVQNLKIIAHRGDGPTSQYSGAPENYSDEIAPPEISDVPVELAPENTLKSIQKAIDGGADGAEIDVYLAKDGVVVIHDDWLNANVRGANRASKDLGRVADKTIQELKQYDVGQGEKIPTLQEVIDLIHKENLKRRKAGKEDFILNIEFKEDAANLMEGVEQTFEVVEKNIEQEKISKESILYGSFSHEALSHLDKIARKENKTIQVLPQFKTKSLFGVENIKMPGWIVDSNQPYLKKTKKTFNNLTGNPSIVGLDAILSDINSSLVETAQEKKVAIAASTSNYRDFSDATFADQLVKMTKKVPVYFKTDVPKEAREILMQAEIRLAYSRNTKEIFEEGRIKKPAPLPDPYLSKRKNNVTSSTHLKDQFNPEEKIIIAIDSGSGATKFGFAKFNKKTNNIENIDYAENKSIQIKLAENLENKALIKEIEETGYIQNAYNKANQPLNICEVFKPELNNKLSFTDNQSSLETRKHLESRYGNKFSTELKEKYLQYITSTVNDVKGMYPNHKIEVHLVGTAALRKADDGQYLLKELEKNLNKEPNIKTNIKIISQEDEGIYAFEGAVKEGKFDPEKVISWDIGGGSMQITGKKNKGYKVLGGTVASSTFKPMVTELLGKDPVNSIYPLNSEEIQKSIALAKEKISFNVDDEKWLNKKKSKIDHIVGVGNIHSSLLRIMQKNEIIPSTQTTYTSKELGELINLFSNKNANEIEKLVLTKDVPFTENLLTNMILVKASMEKYNINSVKVIPVSNTNTVISKAIDRPPLTTDKSYVGNITRRPSHTDQNTNNEKEISPPNSSYIVLEHEKPSTLQNNQQLTALPQGVANADNHSVNNNDPSYSVGFSENLPLSQVVIHVGRNILNTVSESWISMFGENAESTKVKEAIFKSKQQLQTLQQPLVEKYKEIIESYQLKIEIYNKKPNTQLGEEIYQLEQLKAQAEQINKDLYQAQQEAKKFEADLENGNDVKQAHLKILEQRIARISQADEKFSKGITENSKALTKPTASELAKLKNIYQKIEEILDGDEKLTLPILKDVKQLDANANITLPVSGSAQPISLKVSNLRKIDYSK